MEVIDLVSKDKQFERTWHEPPIVIHFAGHIYELYGDGSWKCDGKSVWDTHRDAGD